jgi:hypothetical protein
MIDFTISQKDLAKASQMMTKARIGVRDELIELTCFGSNVRFLVTGRESTTSATVEATGQAQFPLSVLPMLRKAAATFDSASIRIRIENGRIRVNSMSISMPEIVISKITDRPIDIPDNAPARDILALKFLFSADEMAASDMANRYLAANSARLKAIRSAADTLSPFGITGGDLESLVNIALKSHAERLRPMLKPTLQSERPN